MQQRPSVLKSWLATAVLRHHHGRELQNVVGSIHWPIEAFACQFVGEKARLLYSD
jgi:hypothetical protein